MSIYVIVMSNLGKALIIQGQDAKTTLLKIWKFLITFSTVLDVI